MKVATQYQHLDCRVTTWQATRYNLELRDRMTLTLTLSSKQSSIPFMACVPYRILLPILNFMRLTVLELEACKRQTDGRTTMSNEWCLLRNDIRRISVTTACGAHIHAHISSWIKAVDHAPDRAADVDARPASDRNGRPSIRPTSGQHCSRFLSGRPIDSFIPGHATALAVVVVAAAGERIHVIMVIKYRGT